MFKVIAEDLKQGEWKVDIKLCGNFLEFDLKGVKGNLDDEMRLYLDGASGFLLVSETDTIEFCRRGYHITNWIDSTEFWIIKKDCA